MREAHYHKEKIQTLDGDEMGSVTGGYLRLIALIVPGSIKQGGDAIVSSFFLHCGKSQEVGYYWTQLTLDDLNSETESTYYCVPFDAYKLFVIGLGVSRSSYATGNRSPSA
jgi:hypothetical protein